MRLRRHSRVGAGYAFVVGGNSSKYLVATSSSSAGNGSLIEPLASISAPIQRASSTFRVSALVFAFMLRLSVAPAYGCVAVDREQVLRSYLT
jgi:hypothetical protein